MQLCCSMGRICPSGSDKDGKPAAWKVENGYMEVVAKTGNISTRDSFGDCQLHVEFSEPTPADGESQERGNSGVFLMSTYEVQVLDSYENKTYADGQAGAVYGQYPPLVNASRPPGHWQTYDVIFHGPRFANGQVDSILLALRCYTTACWCRTTSNSPDRRLTASVLPTSLALKRRHCSCRITEIRCASAISGFGNCTTNSATALQKHKKPACSNENGRSGWLPGLELLAQFALQQLPGRRVRQFVHKHKNIGQLPLRKSLCQESA